MKPNDLRIGCFVKLRDSGEVVKVERLSRKKVGFHYGNDKSRGYFRKYTEIEGVLIYDAIKSVDHLIDLYWHDDYDDGKWYGYCNCDRAFRYIHELQNLHFALTGDELKIEL